MHFTTTELDRLHRHFNNPQPERLAAVLRRAGGPLVTPDVQEALNKNTAACDVCQRLAAAPRRFRIAMPPDDLSFNHKVYIDLMYLEGKSVMHVVYRDTALSAAAFTNTERADVLWQLYCSIWAHPYVFHPSCMHVDQGPQFTSPHGTHSPLLLVWTCCVSVLSRTTHSAPGSGIMPSYGKSIAESVRSTRLSCCLGLCLWRLRQ